MTHRDQFDIVQLWKIRKALAEMPSEGRTPEALELEHKRLMEFGRAFEDQYEEFEKYQKRRAAESYNRVHVAEREVIQHKYFVRERDKEIARLQQELWRNGSLKIMPSPMPCPTPKTVYIFISFATFLVGLWVGLIV